MATRTRKGAKLQHPSGKSATKHELSIVAILALKDYEQEKPTSKGSHLVHLRYSDDLYPCLWSVLSFHGREFWQVPNGMVVMFWAELPTPSHVIDYIDKKESNDAT